jgi:cysteinyl-tRNA synthetase
MLAGVGCSTHTRAHTHKHTRTQADEFALSGAIQEAQSKVHEALCDNINTPGALDALTGLVRATNTYLAAKQAAAGAAAAVHAGSNGDAAAAAADGLAAAGPQPLLLRKAAAFVTRILSVFGLLPVRACVGASRRGRLSAARASADAAACAQCVAAAGGSACGAPHAAVTPPPPPPRV